MHTQSASAKIHSRASLAQSRPASALTGVLASLVLHLFPAPAAAQVIVTPLVLSGSAAPGGGTYSGFGVTPVLNASGQVAFFADLTGGLSTRGVFAGTPGSFQAVARNRAAAPAGGYYYD